MENLEERSIGEVVTISLKKLTSRFSSGSKEKTWTPILLSDRWNGYAFLVDEGEELFAFNIVVTGDVID